jgi:hypothetical protein
MKAAGTLLLVTGIMEAILGIPVLGGALVIFSGYTALFIALVLHIVTLVLCSQNNRPITGSILGIVTSVLAWIPVLGMIMHIATAIVLLMAATKKVEQPMPPYPPAPGSF